MADRNDDKYLEVVDSRWKHSEDYHQSHLNKLATYYDSYRGITRANFPAYRHNVFLPYTFSVVQSDVARKVQVSFSAWPIVSFAGYGLDDGANAWRNEVLVSAQMKDSDSFTKAVDFYLNADLYGNGIVRYGWKRVKRTERWRENQQIGPEMVVPVVQSGEVVRFDGPDWEVVDRLDFGPQPGKKRIKDMAWVCHRYYLDLDDIRAYAKTGMFDPAAISKLELSSAPESVEQGMTYPRMSPYRAWSDWDARIKEKFAKPIEIIEMWGRVPDELAFNGTTNLVISIANRRVVLRVKGLSEIYGDGEKPFISYSPMPDPHYFDGVGKAEIAAKMQAMSNKLASNKLDAIELFMNPVFLYNRSVGLDTTNMFMRPGRLIGVDGPVSDDIIRPISPDLRGLTETRVELEYLWRSIQQGTGIAEDVVQGMPSSGRQTAREFLGRQESVATRLMLEARLAEEGFVEPLANAYRILNRQYLDVPHMVKILGPSALTNPITGLPLPPEPVVVSLEDLNGDYRARAIGSSMMLGKSIKQQNILAMLQAMSSNPILMQMVNWASFAREMFMTFDLKNVNELLVSQIPQINQFASENGIDPMQLAGQLSQGPEAIGQMQPGMFTAGEQMSPMAMEAA